MRFVDLFCVLAILLAACAPAAEPGGAPNTAGNSGAPPVATPRPTKVEQTLAKKTAPATSKQANCEQNVGSPTDQKKAKAAYVTGMTRFGVDLYRNVTEKDKGANLIYSPYSISSAFSMVYAGACAQTEAQMAKVLGYLPQASQHRAAAALRRRPAAVGVEHGNGDMREGEPFILKDAAAVWGQEGYPFAEAYERTLAEHYGAKVRPVNFEMDPESGRKLVNDWVVKETEGNIQDILPKGSVTTDARLILANVIYFKAGWLYPFDGSNFGDGTFKPLDGRRVPTVMMTQDKEYLAYSAEKDYEAVWLPYVGESTSMLLIVPKAGRFEQVEADLDADFLT